MHDQCTRGMGGVDVCMISALGVWAALVRCADRLAPWSENNL